MCTPGLCVCGRCGTSGKGDVREALRRLAEKMEAERARDREREARRTLERLERGIPRG